MITYELQKYSLRNSDFRYRFIPTFRELTQLLFFVMSKRILPLLLRDAALQALLEQADVPYQNWDDS